MEAAFDKAKYPQYAMTIDWVLLYEERAKKLEEMTEQEVRRFWLDLADLTYYPQGFTLFKHILRLRDRVSAKLAEYDIKCQEVTA
jgi:hypothetical protein